MAREPLAELEDGVTQLQVENFKVLGAGAKPPDRELHEPTPVLDPDEPGTGGHRVELVREADGR